MNVISLPLNFIFFVPYLYGCLQIYTVSVFGSPASPVCLLSSEAGPEQALKYVETKLLNLYLRFLSMKIENSNFEMFSF